MTNLKSLVDRLRELESKATSGQWECVNTIQDDEETFIHCGIDPIAEKILGRDAKLITETKEALPLLIKAIDVYREALEYVEGRSLNMPSSVMLIEAITVARKALADADKILDGHE